MALTERRKADRQKMADMIAGDWQAAPGFIVAERLDPAPCSPRGIWLHLEGPRGVRLTVDFDGDSCQPDTHVLSWHMALDSDATFSACFAGSRNEYHRQKATDIAEGFDELRALLNRRITSLQRGEAFEDGTRVAVIAR